MQVVFRVDADQRMGIGHFMRCFNLANGLVKKSAKVVFISRELPAQLSKMLKTACIDLLILKSVCADAATNSTDSESRTWLPWSQEEDSRLTGKFVSSLHPDWLVVDHYGLDAEWEECIQQWAGKIMVIDDLANRAHSCDALVDQNLFQEPALRYSGKTRKNPFMLLGPKYALLHPAFGEARSHLARDKSVATKLLVFFGGGDHNNCTEFVLDVLKEMACDKFKVTVVIGGQHPALHAIRHRATDDNFQLYVHSDEIPRLMADADLCIGGGGVSTWERCCLGLPCLIISIAENQEPIAEAVSAIGAARYLGRQVDLEPTDLSSAVTALAADTESRRRMSVTAMSLVDGKGVDRTLELMFR
jgi:UDP-2,4-diacetamido-2,4,6-trideoxy-beta-L-altropyranose hydrolase